MNVQSAAHYSAAAWIALITEVVRGANIKVSCSLVRAKGGFAIFIINSVSIMQKIASLRQVFDWILPFLCQFWLKSQHGCLRRTSLGYDPSSICFDSHLFHHFCQHRTLSAFSPLLSPSFTPHPIPLLTSQRSSALLGVGCQYCHPQFDPIQSCNLLCHQYECADFFSRHFGMTIAGICQNTFSICKRTSSNVFGCCDLVFSILWSAWGN